jgi:predicted dehydrogenase
MREQYGCRTYDRIEDMVLDEGVELIDIATRSVDHLRHAKMALEAGKYLIKKYKRDALLSQRQLAVKN